MPAQALRLPSRFLATRVAAAAPKRRIIGGAGTGVPPVELELEPPLEDEEEEDEDDEEDELDELELDEPLLDDEVELPPPKLDEVVDAPLDVEVDEVLAPELVEVPCELELEPDEPWLDEP